MAKQQQYNNASRPRLKYDAHGRLVQNEPKSGAFRFFIGFLIPYLIINGIILFLVIASPKITYDDPDTKDYKTATMQIQIHSLLPLKTLQASMEGVAVPLSRDGSNYIASVTDNGTLTVLVQSINGMQKVEHIPVNLLDKTAPLIDEDSVDLGSGYLEFKVSDTQSGVDYDSIYGVDADGDNVKPTDVNKTSGQVTFSMKSDSIQVFVSDLAGNQVPATFSVK